MKALFVARSTLFSQYGGDSVQVENTARALEKRGHHVKIITAGTPTRPDEFDVIHFFNIGRPADFVQYLHSDTPIVVSSIFVDYLETELRHPSRWRRTVAKLWGTHGIEYLKVLARWVRGTDRFPGMRYLLAGHWRTARYILAEAKAVITSSQNERLRLHDHFGELPPVSVIGLGINEAFFRASENPNRQGVIYVGRIEHRKNLLNLIKACKMAKLPLTVVGEGAVNQPDYETLCRQEADDSVTFVGAIPQADLPEIYARHRVVALPSYFETYGLTGIEGYACGCNVVFSSRGDMEEIYRSMGIPCNPDDVTGIAKALGKAHALGNKIPEREKLEKYSWDKIAGEVIAVYEKTITP